MSDHSITDDVRECEPSTEQTQAVARTLGHLSGIATRQASMPYYQGFEYAVTVQAMDDLLTAFPDVEHLREQLAAWHPALRHAVRDTTDQWWLRRDDDTDQSYANRIEEHNPTEEQEVWAANQRARAARREGKS